MKGSLPLHHPFPRLCHREEYKVLWTQPRQHDWGEPRDLCPSLFQGLPVHTLDTQPNPTGRQMLAQNKPGKLRTVKLEVRTSQVHNRFKLWSESLRRKRVLPPTGPEHNCCSCGKLHFSLDRAPFRLLLDWRPEPDVVRGEERMQEDRRIPCRD